MQEEKNLSNENFVTGIAQGTIKFKVVDAHKLVKLFDNSFEDWAMTILLVFLVAPIIAIPVLCYVFGKWILLLGFLGSFFGWVIHGFSMNANKPIKSFVLITFLFSILTTAMIYFFSIFFPLSFIITCAFYQFFFFNFSGKLDDAIAKSHLTKDANIYYSAVENKFIKTFRVS